MNPTSILSHNILQCYIGTDENGPVVQLATLQEIGQLPAFNFLLAKYWQIVNAGQLQTPPKNILADLKAEWLTLTAVLAHKAYSHLSFSPSTFSESIQSPNLWLGQSYYRIRRLLCTDIPRGDVVSAIYLIAHHEAAAAEFAINEAASTLTDPIVINADSFEQQTVSHETY